MIHRDYMMRMIQEFAQMIMRIMQAGKDGNYPEATQTLREAVERLIGSDGAGLEERSVMSLKGLLAKSGSTHELHGKCLIMTALLKEAGDLHAAQGQIERARECYLKGLNLLLDTIFQFREHNGQDFGFGARLEIFPRVEVFLTCLEGIDLPQETLAGLMQYFERVGEFGRAEDYFFELFEIDSTSPEMTRFGEDFYRRLLALSDEDLREGNLPRSEVKAGLNDLRSRAEAAR